MLYNIRKKGSVQKGSEYISDTFFVTIRKEHTKNLSVNEKLVMNGLYYLYLLKERCKLITTMSKKMMMMMVFMKMMVSMIMMVIMMMINSEMDCTTDTS